jgi:glutathione S-transferase
VLRETQTPFDLDKTDLRAKKTAAGEDHFTKNPGGYVPALELEDGSVLTEGPVTVQYIADKAGKLAPTFGSMERYRMMSWLNFISSELHKGFSPLFNAQMPEEAKKIVRDRLNLRLGVVDKHLSSKDFLMGKDFTIADAYLFTVLSWTKRPVGIDLAQYPALSAFQARVAARPAVQVAMKAEDLT